MRNRGFAPRVMEKPMRAKIRPEDTVQESSSDLFMGGLMAVFGVVGLLLASGARDIEMLVFGASLALFAVLFDAGLIKRHFDIAQAIAAQKRGQP